MTKTSRSFLSLAALSALTACGNLLDAQPDGLQLAPTSPGLQFCNGGFNPGGSAGSNNGGSGGVLIGGKGGAGGSSAGAGGKAGGGGFAGGGGASGKGGSGNAGSGGAIGGSGGQGGAIGGSGGQGGAIGGSGGISSGGASGQGGAASGAGGEAGAPMGGAGGAGGAGGGQAGMGAVTGSPYDPVVGEKFSDFMNSPLVIKTGGLAAIKTGDDSLAVYGRNELQQVVRANYSEEMGWGQPVMLVDNVTADPAVVEDDAHIKYLLVNRDGQGAKALLSKGNVVSETPISLNGLLAPLPPDSAIVGVPGADNTIEVFARSQDDEVVTSALGSTQSPWQSLGGKIASSPAAVRDEVGSVYVFVRWQVDNSVMVNHRQDGVWSGWVSWGGVSISSSPAVASWTRRRLDVFARGLDGKLVYRAQREDGSLAPGWTPLPTAIEETPAAVALALGDLRVLARDQNGAVGMARLEP